MTRTRYLTVLIHKRAKRVQDFNSEELANCDLAVGRKNLVWKDRNGVYKDGSRIEQAELDEIVAQAKSHPRGHVIRHG